jgi:hypothetical protein
MEASNYYWIAAGLVIGGLATHFLANKYYFNKTVVAPKSTEDSFAGRAPALNLGDRTAPRPHGN